VKRLFLQSLIASSLLLSPVILATAQAADEQLAAPYYSADEYQNAHSMFDKIRADLDRAQANDHPKFLGDGARFDIARMQLGQLETQWNHADFDTSTFDSTYTALNMVLNDNRLTGHDRDVLSADESRLIEFRNEYY
jgi:hypothetical protein